MTSAGNDVPRSVVGGSGVMTGSASANNRLDAASEEIGGSSAASTNNRLAPGFIQIFAFPGTVTQLTSLDDETAATVHLRWTVPGVDGEYGTLPPGSSYYIRVASYTVPDSFSRFSDANVVFSTAGTFPGTEVSSRAAGLIPNTTYSVMLWSKSPAGDLSYPMTFFATATTLAAPVTLLSESFLNVISTSGAAQWAARPSLSQDVSSMTAEGYRVEASSTNFGALTPGGAVYSSMTANVLLSTLTISVPFPGHLCVDHYFRVASLNWRGFPNYTVLGSTRAPDDYGVLVSTQDLTIGGIDINTEVVISTSLLLSSLACPVTYRLQVEAITPGTPWVIAASPGADAVTVKARFNTVQPALGDFVAGDTLTTFPVTSTPTKFAGNQTGVNVPLTEGRLLWFKLSMPTSTSVENQQQIRVTVYAIPP